MFPSFQLDIKDVSSVSAISIITLTLYQYNMSTKLPLKRNNGNFPNPCFPFPEMQVVSDRIWLSFKFNNTDIHSVIQMGDTVRRFYLLDISCRQRVNVCNTSKVT